MSTVTSSRIAAGLAQVGVKYPANWNELGSSAKDLWEERQVRSLVKQGKPLDVWLHFAEREEDMPDDADDETDHEANIYFNADGTYRVEWYHTAVGLVTSRSFDTYPEARAWLEEGGYQDFSS